MNSEWKFHFVRGAHIVQLTYSKVMELTHMTEECYGEGSMLSINERKNLRFNFLESLHLNSDFET